MSDLVLTTSSDSILRMAKDIMKVFVAVHLKTSISLEEREEKKKREKKEEEEEERRGRDQSISQFSCSVVSDSL